MSETMVLVRFLPKSGEENRAEAVLRTMVAKTRQEPGNESYDLFKSVEDGRTWFVLLERYVDAAAQQAHRETPHYQEYRAGIAPLLEAPIAITALAYVDVGAPARG